MKHYKRFIGFDGGIPHILGTRVSVIDVVEAKENPNKNQDELFDQWNLSEKQVNAALNYYEEHTEEINQLKE